MNSDWREASNVVNVANVRLCIMYMWAISTKSRTDRQTLQTGSRTNKQTGKHTDRQADMQRQTDIAKHKNKQIDKPRDRHVSKRVFSGSRAFSYNIKVKGVSELRWHFCY